jgi:DNA-binding GntR family transcriptional regulator
VTVDGVISRSARRRGRTRTEVYGRLRDAIVATELAPGCQVSENELATWLGVSRTPVREALVRLTDDRLVEIVPQLGTFVTRISQAAVSDAQFIREALECSAARLAADKVDRNDVRVLKGIVARQEDVRDAGDYDRWYVLDDEFHRTLCELGGHPVAWSLVQRVNGQLNRVRRLSLPQPRYLQEMVAEHKLVVRAVARGETDAAEDAMRHHLRMVISALPAIRVEHPEFFEDA